MSASRPLKSSTETEPPLPTPCWSTVAPHETVHSFAVRWIVLGLPTSAIPIESRKRSAPLIFASFAPLASRALDLALDGGARLVYERVQGDGLPGLPRLAEL